MASDRLTNDSGFLISWMQSAWFQYSKHQIDADIQQASRSRQTGGLGSVNNVVMPPAGPQLTLSGFCVPHWNNQILRVNQVQHQYSLLDILAMGL